MTPRLRNDPLTGQEDDDVMRRIKTLGAPPANTFGPPPTRPGAAGPLDAPPPTTNFGIPPTRPMAGPLDGPPAAGTGAREVELSARRRTNAAHSASVDATERAWASRPPVGANSLSARASDSDGAVRSGPLSTRGATPVGRSMREAPERRLETAARRGDLRATQALVGMKQQQQGMDFARERDATNFDQQREMFGLQQQSQQARDEQQRQERFGMFSAEQAAREAQEAQRWNQQLTIFGMEQGNEAMRAERERAQRDEERNRRPNVGTTPIAGTDYVMSHADGRPMGTLPVQRKQAPLPPGMVPVQAERDGVQYGAAQPRAPGVPTIKEFKTAAGISEYREYNEQTGKWRKVQFEDENNDGIDDRQQMGGGDQGSLSTRPAQSTSGGRRVSPFVAAFGNQ